MEDVSIRSMKRLQAAPAWRVCLCGILFAQVLPLSQLQISLNDRDQGAALCSASRSTCIKVDAGFRESNGRRRVEVLEDL